MRATFDASVGIVTLAGPLLFFLWLLWVPRISIRFGGEQLGEVIPLPRNGRIPFATTVASKRPCRLLRLWVEFNPDEVELSARGAELAPSLDVQLAAALTYEGERTIAKKRLAGNFFDYSIRKDGFRVRFVATARRDDAELPFLLSMFPSRTIRFNRTAYFVVGKVDQLSLTKYGVPLRPGESVEMCGEQSEEAVYAATEKGTAKVRAIEFLKRTL